jgi:hypothetical protein
MEHFGLDRAVRWLTAKKHSAAQGVANRESNTQTMAKLQRASKRKYPASHSAALKAKWQDPEYRAKMAARDSRREELRQADPAKFSRLGVPNGMRKEEAQQKWDIAEKQAAHIIKTLKAEGLLPETAIATATVPDTENEMAEAVLREMFKLALGPTGTRAKLSALNTILQYTRLKPISVLKLALGDAAGVLDEMAAG